MAGRGCVPVEARTLPTRLIPWILRRQETPSASLCMQPMSSWASIPKSGWSGLNLRMESVRVGPEVTVGRRNKGHRSYLSVSGCLHGASDHSFRHHGGCRWSCPLVVDRAAGRRCSPIPPHSAGTEMGRRPNRFICDSGCRGGALYRHGLGCAQGLVSELDPVSGRAIVDKRNSHVSGGHAGW